MSSEQITVQGTSKRDAMLISCYHYRTSPQQISFLRSEVKYDDVSSKSADKEIPTVL
jgi:hypothetical protein